MTSDHMRQLLPADRPAGKGTLIGYVILTGILTSAAVRMFTLAYCQEDLFRRVAEILAIAMFLAVPCRLAQMTINANRIVWQTIFERRLQLAIQLFSLEDKRLRTDIWLSVLAIVKGVLHVWPLENAKPGANLTLGIIYSAIASLWLWVLYQSPKPLFSALPSRKT